MAVTGCDGPGVQRRPVFGTIQGAEDAEGLIAFIPVNTPPNRPSANTKITDGRYEFASDNGPFSGEYRVLIQLRRAPSNPDTEPEEQDSQKAIRVDRRRRPVLLPEPEVDETALEGIIVPEQGPWQLDFNAS